MDWRAFHEFTNHSPNRPGGRSDAADLPRPMDPERRPEPFKTYQNGPETIPLEWEIDSWTEGKRDGDGMDLRELSRILLVGAGAKKYRSPRLKGRYFRTYASAGALHPNEVYLATRGTEEIEAGLFHLDPKQRQVVRLGSGDPRLALAQAAHDEELGRMQALLIITGIPWRTSWKYGPRGYRHLWWDAGMIIANLIALAGARDHPSKIACMFDDAGVNELLGIDGRTEMALAMVGIGEVTEQGDAPYSSHGLTAATLGPDPFEYPEISQVHAATDGNGDSRDAKSLAVPPPPGPAVERTIWRRGSAREFDEEASATSEQLREILRYADQPLPVDWGAQTNQLLLIAHSVEGVEAGAYRWDGAGLELIRHDPESRESGYFLSLDQELGADGVATIFPMADLNSATETLGPRGYRAAQLEGAIRSGLIYLAAYGLGLGASGLTFYDDEVSKYFDVKTVPMLEVAVGRPLARKPPKEPSDEVINLDLLDETIEEDVPRGWRGRIKGYRCEVENGTLTVRSDTKRESWCNVGHTVKAGEYRGKKIRFSATIATQITPTSWAGLYASVNDKDRAPLSFDNMEDRPIKEETEFTRHSIELPLDPKADSISFGILLIGQGEVQIRDLELQSL